MKRLIIIVSTVATLTLALGGIASGTGNAAGKTPVSPATHCC